MSAIPLLNQIALAQQQHGFEQVMPRAFPNRPDALQFIERHPDLGYAVSASWASFGIEGRINATDIEDREMIFSHFGVLPLLLIGSPAEQYEVANSRLESIGGTTLLPEFISSRISSILREIVDADRYHEVLLLKQRAHEVGRWSMRIYGNYELSLSEHGRQGHSSNFQFATID